MYRKELIAAIDTWILALLAYLIPLGLFLMAWGGIGADRARRAATIGGLAFGLAILGYSAAGFAFHLGGAYIVNPLPGLTGLDHLLPAQINDSHWRFVGFFLGGDDAMPAIRALFITCVPLAAAVLLVTMSILPQKCFTRAVG